jgi:hypothetical protein
VGTPFFFSKSPKTMKKHSLRDGELLNCTQQDIDHLISLYPEHEQQVRAIIHQACALGVLQYYTHQDVHYYVQRHLGLEE